MTFTVPLLTDVPLILKMKKKNFSKFNLRNVVQCSMFLFCFYLVFPFHLELK